MEIAVNNSTVIYIQWNLRSKYAICKYAYGFPTMLDHCSASSEEIGKIKIKVCDLSYSRLRVKLTNLYLFPYSIKTNRDDKQLIVCFNTSDNRILYISIFFSTFIGLISFLVDSGIYRIFSWILIAGGLFFVRIPSGKSESARNPNSSERKSRGYKRRRIRRIFLVDFHKTEICVFR